MGLPYGDCRQIDESDFDKVRKGHPTPPHRGRGHLLVQPRRDAQTATLFFIKLLRKAHEPPGLVVTDKLASYIRPCADA